MTGTVRIEGLRELQRAFRAADRALARELRTALKEAGEPVRVAAEELAQSEIRNIGPRWWRMRLGVTARGVYIAPATRRSTRRSNPKFGGLLIQRAMVPAKERHQEDVVGRIEKVLDVVGSTWATA